MKKSINFNIVLGIILISLYHFLIYSAASEFLFRDMCFYKLDWDIIGRQSKFIRVIFAFFSLFVLFGFLAYMPFNIFSLLVALFSLIISGVIGMFTGLTQAYFVFYLYNILALGALIYALKLLFKLERK